MRADKLELTGFRNYTEAVVKFGPGINILYGDNAQGKTNLLEAVYLFSMGKASRAARDAELIMHGKDSATLALAFTDRLRTNRAEAELFRSRRKLIRMNDIPIKRNSELVGRFLVVYFGPEYLGLVKEGPKRRRQTVDILISQLRPRYFSSLARLKKIVESKNTLLKGERADAAMLEVMNAQLVDVSCEIMKYRSIYISRIEEIAKRIQLDISQGRETLEMRYQSCIGDIRGLDDRAIKQRLAQRVESAGSREALLGETVVGPHREDIGFFLGDKEAKAFASQGQQKTIVLVEKLAEAELLRMETEDTPVLLLDDIMSELDSKRRAYILQHIRDMQILITCTDTQGFPTGENTRLFRVEAGTVTPE